MDEQKRWGRLPRWARGGSKDQDMTTNEDTMQDSILEGQEQAIDATEQQPEAVVAPPAVAQDNLQMEMEQATGERDALRDRLARLQAEFDNARKREARERQDARDYAVQGAIEPFLSVMDNFHLALKANGSAEQLKTGVEMILRQMDEALKSLNVQPVESIGAQFDPKLHEALGSIETQEAPDHQVLEEIRRGYRLRDKLLRPALVRIASNPSQVND